MIAHPGLRFIDHRVAVPLDHRRPDEGSIEVFAREVVAADRAGDDLPWLLFVQGGPSVRPGARLPGAAARALHDHPAFAGDADPVLFTGEMMYPWMFEQIAALRPFAGAATFSPRLATGPCSTTAIRSPQTKSR
jgi:hypothetical protein